MPLRRFPCRRADVQIFGEASAMGEAAARHAAATLAGAAALRGRARVIVGTGPSQLHFIAALARDRSLDWSAVEVFHMDEYVGMPATHPASFRRWLRDRLTGVVHPARVELLAGDAPCAETECRRYAALLAEAQVDVVFVGFGENGHIAFNDPDAADFEDPLAVKRVALDARCRAQQAGEGHFPDAASVPREALTVTCPTILGARRLICCVPDRRKAEAVRDALEGPVSPRCPASAVTEHHDCTIYLDAAAASLLAR